MSLEFADLHADIYKNGSLPVHVTAFRPLLGKNYYDIIVTDYTRHDASPFPIEANRVVLAMDEKAQLKIPFGMFSSLTEAYHDQTQRELFSATDVCPENSAWIDISSSYCFANFRISLQVGQPPFVKWATLVSRPSRQFSQLWERFLAAVLGRVAVDKQLLLRIVEPCLTKGEQGLLETSLPGDSTSYSTEESQHVENEEIDENPIKDESEAETTEIREEALEAQQHFSSTLESVPFRGMASGRYFRANTIASSTPFQESGAADKTGAIQETQELLTQVPVFQNSSQSQSQNSSQYQSQSQNQSQDQNSTQQSQKESLSFPESEEFPISLSQIYSAQQEGNPVSLAALKKVPLVEDFRVFKVRTKLVGTFPDDLMYVCTKTYIEKNGQVVLGDPQIRALELLVSDTDGKNVTSYNSMAIHVPQNNVLAFFGCEHIEQLYTQMEAKKAEFAKLYSSAITLEVSVSYAGSTGSTNSASYAGRPVMWVLNDRSRMSVLSNELV